MKKNLLLCMRLHKFYLHGMIHLIFDNPLLFYGRNQYALLFISGTKKSKILSQVYNDFFKVFSEFSELTSK